MPLAGELEVVTICPDFFCVLRAIFYDAIKCLFTITVSGFVARHKVHSLNKTRRVDLSLCRGRDWPGLQAWLLGERYLCKSTCVNPTDIAGLAYASSQRAREDESGGLHTHTRTRFWFAVNLIKIKSRVCSALQRNIGRSRLRLRCKS